jgi:hypothetical protein
MHHRDMAHFFSSIVCTEQQQEQEQESSSVPDDQPRLARRPRSINSRVSQASLTAYLSTDHVSLSITLPDTILLAAAAIALLHLLARSSWYRRNNLWVVHHAKPATVWHS